ncbi:MAG TPA: hypothetical protein VFK34_05070 [Marmoricola sp.]|jgi:hypothetical protein|nr:hypothetical protein [Marmoricola sp.]
MTSPARRPGRLPARVYWFRRGLVLFTAFALVFGFARLLGGGAEADEAPQAAAPAAAHPSTAAPTQPIGPMPLSRAKKKGKHKAAATAPLAQPSGDCDVDEITVRAALDVGHAGGDVRIPLELTGTQAACRFRVSPSTVVVKIVSGSDRIWSSQDCGRAIKPQDVVVRSARPTTVEMTWNGRRSEDGCPGGTRWAMPGWYHAVTAAIGSEPSDTQFQLTLPNRPVITKTASPRPEKKQDEQQER